MPLKVIDKTGRLPKNPKDWPAELKRAIAECCCSDESSSSSSSIPGGRKTACCPNTSLPDVINATISGGTAIDGSYALTWDETLQAWATAKIFQFSCFIGLSTHTFSFRLTFDLFCEFIWEQFDDNGFFEVVSGRMASTWPIPAGCVSGFVCSPLYLAAGLQAIGGFPPRKVCNGTVDEINSSCSPTFSGPFVEVTL